MILTPEVRALLKRMDADDAIDKAVELALEAAAKECDEDAASYSEAIEKATAKYGARCTVARALGPAMHAAIECRDAILTLKDSK